LKQTLSQETLIFENPNSVASLGFIASVLLRQKERERAACFAAGIFGSRAVAGDRS